MACLQAMVVVVLVVIGGINRKKLGKNHGRLEQMPLRCDT
jgi:hypothetical protein